MLQSEYRVTVRIDGFDWGVWSNKEGGEASSEASKHFPGGLTPAISRSGPAQLGDITLQRYVADSSMQTRVKTLMNQVGKAIADVVVQPLDANGTAWGEAMAYRGPLISVKPGDHDASSNDFALIEIVVSPSGNVA